MICPQSRPTPYIRMVHWVPEDPVNLPDHARVEVVIRKKFSEFVKKFGEPEAKEEVDKLLQTNRRRRPDA